MQRTLVEMVSLVSLLAVGCASVPATPVRPAPSIEWAAPVVSLTEMNPWRMVIGSDSATFVLYEDGRVIFHDPDLHQPPGYRVARLSATELQALRAQLKLERLASLQERYETSFATDLPTTSIVTFADKQPHPVSVYGVLDAGQAKQVIATTIGPSSRQPDPVPPEFAEIFHVLKTSRPKESQPWTPEVIEVMVSPYENAPEQKRWPAGWVDLSSPGAVEPKGDYAGKFFVDGRDLPQLSAFLQSLGEKEAVVMNGRKLFVSLRVVLPGETRWAKSLPSPH
jgi:hypothetical protein